MPVFSLGRGQSRKVSPALMCWNDLQLKQKKKLVKKIIVVLGPGSTDGVENHIFCLIMRVWPWLWPTIKIKFNPNNSSAWPEVISQPSAGQCRAGFSPGWLWSLSHPSHCVLLTRSTVRTETHQDDCLYFSPTLSRMVKSNYRDWFNFPQRPPTTKKPQLYLKERKGKGNCCVLSFDGKFCLDRTGQEEVKPRSWHFHVQPCLSPRFTRCNFIEGLPPHLPCDIVTLLRWQRRNEISKPSHLSNLTLLVIGP